MAAESLDDLLSAEGPKNTSSEDKEKDRARSAQAAAGIQRTQKDEKRAKKTDDLLAKILSQMLQDPRNMPLLLAITPLIEKRVPTAYIAGLMSLSYQPLSDAIRTGFCTPPKQPLHFSYLPFGPQDFNAQTLAAPLKERIQAWIEDIVDSVMHDPSHLLTARFLQDIHANTEGIKTSLLSATSSVLIGFFEGVEVRMSTEEAQLYSQFILDKALGMLRVWFIREGDTELVSTSESGGEYDWFFGK